ncbi:hypothetical protein OH77DRAFT_1440218 [Trametes cingulata]|nr:hypothetical protein OH77DRAFT_1440218 [Trametes cingulata]
MTTTRRRTRRTGEEESTAYGHAVCKWCTYLAVVVTLISLVALTLALLVVRTLLIALALAVLVGDGLQMQLRTGSTRWILDSRGGQHGRGDMNSSSLGPELPNSDFTLPKNLRKPTEMSDKPPISPLPSDAVRIDLLHRPQCLPLPDIYKVPGHTLEPDFGAFKRNTYMVIMDDTEDARKSLKEYLDQAHIPQGTPGGIQNAGYFLLKPGDCLIMRCKNWSGREEDDKVQVVVVPHECFSAASRSRFMQVHDTVLSPCGQQKPQKGGVFWEQSDEANDQKAKQLISPMVCNKIKNGELTEHQCLRKELFHANAAIAVQAMELSLPREAKLLQQQAEACNFPQVGISGNFYFPAMQLNLAPAAQAEQATSFRASANSTRPRGNVKIGTPKCKGAYVALALQLTLWVCNAADIPSPSVSIEAWDRNTVMIEVQLDPKGR